MSRLTEWVDMQCRLVQHGGTVAIFRLKGPDETVYGTWPVGLEHIADAISTTIGMLGDELPKGRHGYMLHAYDADGGEVSTLPVGVEGRSSAATSAASEQLTLQKATSAAIFNANVLNEGLRKQLESSNQQLGELCENNAILIDRITTMAATNAARDIEDMRKDALNDALVAICAAVKQHAEPLLAFALEKWGPKPNAPKLAAPSPAPTPPVTSEQPPAEPKPATEPPHDPSPPESPPEPEKSNGQHAPERDPEPGDDIRSDAGHTTARNPTHDRKRSAADRKHGTSSARPPSRATRTKRAGAARNP